MSIPGGEAPHAIPADTLIEQLTSDRNRGLRADQVSARLAEYGYNELATAPAAPLWRKFLAQFRELVVWILIAAALIAGVTGDWIDTGAILAIVLLNAVLGFLQEERAERALEALQQLSAPVAKVIRDGVLHAVPARELVPGDRIELEAGDNAPADARLIEAFGLRVQEAALSGESVPVDKDPDALLSAATVLSDRRNMVYAGTVVAAGKTSAVVVATGMSTELGHIAGMLQRAERKPTPLQRRLTELGKMLVGACLLIVGVIFALELVRGGAFLEVLLVSVSLAVAAVPEGLPAVVTVALALGLQRMARRNALVRNLPSVETLGSVTVICSDKTGTLTRNEMTVREIVAGGTVYRVTGTGYVPRGDFLRVDTAPAELSPLSDDAAPGTAVDPQGDMDLRQALTIAAWCNNARVHACGDDAETWEVIGDPTEGALVVAALKAQIDTTERGRRVLYEIPFDSERKTMSVIVRTPPTGAVMYTKGAPEVILARCTAEQRGGVVIPLVAHRRAEIMHRNGEMAARALRVLALAYRPHTEGASREETDLIFGGLAGMIDPPRDEAREAVDTCRAAGIQAVMITGDHAATALAVARELRLSQGTQRAVTGAELNAMSDEELAAQVDRIAVYARVAAEHKLRVVRAWKQRGQVVAMTGDGVNDAPAVQAADIGIAMGITGTDVTKEASDMVLTDDNFASIVNAVEEGRCIFDNIRKFVHYLLSCNVGEVLFMFVAALIGWPAPLLAIQILWINLVTDGLPALALGVEPPEADIMRRRPHPPHEPVITARRGLLMLWHGLLIATAALVGFAWVYHGDATLPEARAVAFCVMAYAQLLYSFGCRSQRRTLPQLGLLSNRLLCVAVVISGLLQLSVVTLPVARPVFEAPVALARDWLLVVLLAAAPVTIIEISKLARHFLTRR